MMNKSFLSMFLLILLIFSSSEEMIGRTVEGRVCQSPSQKFHGLCLINHNCYVVCQSEGFSGGECDGIRRRCMCTRLC
ncbi:defensin-like protein 1 [Cucurbita maxima]|uniref:Defensin-like protein 1 n=1 Tax=Cucurbita maxima TaxID=3661 RepID=A0A6J1I8M6_CUCMA|nr:defensin-like protein 1 [Cucurbita maxima]